MKPIQLRIIDTRFDQTVTLDRAALFGDGFFTTGLVENSKLLQDRWHLNRLLLAADRLGFSQAFVRDSFAQAKLQLAEYDKVSFRLSINRIQQSRGYAIDEYSRAEALLYVNQWVQSPENPCHLFFANTPVSVNSVLSGIKHNNRLDSVMAASEATGTNQEMLMCHGEDVICGSKSNVFVMLNEQWFTPVIDNAGVSGITRERILTLASANNIHIKQQALSRDLLEQAQSIFVSNSLLGMWPAARIGDKPLAVENVRQLESKLNFTR